MSLLSEEKLLSERGEPALIGRAVSLLAWLAVDRRLEMEAREETAGVSRLADVAVEVADRRRGFLAEAADGRLANFSVGSVNPVLFLTGAGADTLKYDVVGFCTSLGLVLTLLRCDDALLLSAAPADSRLDWRCNDPLGRCAAWLELTRTEPKVRATKPFGEGEGVGYGRLPLREPLSESMPAEPGGVVSDALRWLTIEGAIMAVRSVGDAAPFARAFSNALMRCEISDETPEPLRGLVLPLPFFAVVGDGGLSGSVDDRVFVIPRASDAGSTGCRRRARRPAPSC